PGKIALGAILDRPEQADGLRSRERLEAGEPIGDPGRAPGARRGRQGLSQRPHALAELGLDASAKDVVCRRWDEAVVFGGHRTREASATAREPAPRGLPDPAGGPYVGGMRAPGAVAPPPQNRSVVAFGAEVRARDAAGNERIVVIASAEEVGLVPHAAT